MNSQIKIEFTDLEFDYGRGEFKNEEEVAESNDGFDCDKLMKQLEILNENAERDLKMIQDMIDDLQRDWTEEEKLQINNPKEYQRLQNLKKPKEMPKELSSEAIETLKNSKVDGLIVRLPEGQLDRKVYVAVKNSLELIGGKWKGGKVMGFVFQEDPSELLAQIAGGEQRNLKKEFQFFGTPDGLADELVALAFNGSENAEPIDVAEPSAGQGAIVKAINRKFEGKEVYCYEAMPPNQTILKRIPTVKFLGDDFLTHSGQLFDIIIANPPFSKNQDIQHIMKMWNCLKPNGRLVSIASKHWQMSSNKKEVAFKQFLENNNAEVIEIEAGRFKDSGTMIASVIIVLQK